MGVAFQYSERKRLRNGRARGRNAIDKGETPNAYPLSPVLESADSRLPTVRQEPF
jgi:hypothetical protein